MECGNFVNIARNNRVSQPKMVTGGCQEAHHGYIIQYVRVKLILLPFTQVGRERRIPLAMRMNGFSPENYDKIDSFPYSSPIDYVEHKQMSRICSWFSFCSAWQNGVTQFPVNPDGRSACAMLLDVP